MDKVKIVMDGNEVSVNSDLTILEAAKSIGIDIPHLCYMNLGDDTFKNNCASCRVCVVEVVGRKNLVPSCVTAVQEGMVIKSNSIKVLEKRKIIIELLLSDHPKDCLVCVKNGQCDLQKVAINSGIREIRFDGRQTKYNIETSPSITRDATKCIMCRRCETMCNDVQTCGVLSGIERGFNAVVSTAFDQNLSTSPCTYCGQCVAVCPVGALSETDHTWKLIKDLANPKKKVIVQVAPAVRVALGEEFGLMGQDVSGKLVTALKELGFDQVFDTNFAADLTIMEEAAEFKDRLERHLAGDKSVRLPILTSCCPAWVNFFEHQFPDMLDVPSTAKSPQQMFGSVAKNIWAKEENIAPEDLICVSIMPCLAKKYEAGRDEFTTNGIPDVDYSLSTRELAALLKRANIDLSKIEDTTFDNPLGFSTGAADIFGRTGGVIEAATRTAYEWVTGQSLKNVDFVALRGMDSCRIAEVPVGDLTLRIGIAHGLGAARELLNKVRSNEVELHAIEIMACKGGCVGGGGQPYHHGDFEVIQKRYDAINSIDKHKQIRKSHENPYIKELYAKHLGEPLGHKAHELLHTHYFAKAKETLNK
ncbi:MAG: NADH-dependent [FeFe] hydrogenase, group A6 [Fusobacteriaceae bacterium]